MNKTIDKYIKILKNPPILFSIFGLLLIATIFFSGYLYYRYTQVQKELINLKTNPSAATAEENKLLIAKARQLIRLPQDEDPTVITVYNLDQLKQQPFFQNAKEGDKVLVFNKAKKAVLFDPVNNIIVEVAPLVENSTFPDENIETTPSDSKTTNLRIYLYNGTLTSGITSRVENILAPIYPNLIFADRNNAVKRDYPKTLVASIKPEATIVAKQISETLKASLSSMPEEETIPDNIDIIIIVGQDQVPAVTSTPLPSNITPTLTEP